MIRTSSKLVARLAIVSGVFAAVLSVSAIAQPISAPAAYAGTAYTSGAANAMVMSQRNSAVALITMPPICPHSSPDGCSGGTMH